MYVIPYSKTKPYLYLGVSLLIGVISTFLNTLNDLSVTTHLLIDLIGYGISIYLFLIGVIKSFKKGPGLKIDDQGITDYTNYFNFGLIKWSNILDMGIKEQYFFKTIILKVNNSEKLLNKLKGFKYHHAKLVWNKSKPLIGINSISLDCSFEYLKNLISNELKSKNPSFQSPKNLI